MSILEKKINSNNFACNRKLQFTLNIVALNRLIEGNIVTKLIAHYQITSLCNSYHPYIKMVRININKIFSPTREKKKKKQQANALCVFHL